MTTAHKPRVGIFLVAGDLRGGGGAERQFTDTYDVFQARESACEVFLVVDRASWRNLQTVGRPCAGQRVIRIRSLGDIRNVPRSELRKLVRHPKAFLREVAFRLARRLERIFLTVQWLVVSFRLDVVHIGLVDWMFLPFLRCLSLLPEAVRPRICVTVADCRLAHHMAKPLTPASEYFAYERIFQTVKLDGILSWYEYFKEMADRVAPFVGRPLIHAARYCFVDVARCRPDAVKSNTVIFAGRMAPIKQPLLFVEAVSLAMAREPERAGAWTYVMYGKGPLEGEVRARLQQRGLEGRVETRSHGDMYEVFGGTRLFVSTQDMENFTSLAMLEAMACGNAVIALDVGQTGCFVRDDVNGYLVRSATPEAVAEAMLRYMAAAQDDHERMQAESVRLATHEYTAGNFSREIEQFWLDVLNRPRGVVGHES